MSAADSNVIPFPGSRTAAIVSHPATSRMSLDAAIAAALQQPPRSFPIQTCDQAVLVREMRERYGVPAQDALEIIEMVVEAIR